MVDAPASPAARPPWGLVAVGAALGLVSGLWISERFVPRPPAAPAPSPAATGDVDRLVAALDRLDESMRRTAERLERARTTPPAVEPEAGSAAAPGAMVPGLPPEGVPLVRAWYQRRIKSELADLELVVANPAVKLGNAAAPERVAAARAEWKLEAERLLEHLESLQAVDTELQLARWLDTTGRGRDFPKAWELAELAAALRAAPK